MINRILFFIDIPLSQQYYEKFGLELLQRNGFKVEVWNFAPFLRSQDYHIPDPIEFAGHRFFYQATDAYAAMATLNSNDMVVLFLVYGYHYLSIYRTLSQYNINYTVYSAGALPAFGRRQSTFSLDKFYKLITSPHKSSTLFNYLLIKFIPFHYFGIKPAQFNLVGGEQSLAAYPYPMTSQTKPLWVHYWDYDAYLKEAAQPIAPESNMAVFLDEYLPFHPDFAYNDMNSPVTPETYYPALCRFFDELEKNEGVQVVIAAHPKSQYEHHARNYYNGRLILRGKTIELVHRAKFVITHCSTSIAFAVLFKKPLVFTTTSQIQTSSLQPTLEGMAAILNRPIFDLSQNTSWDLAQVLDIDEAAYHRYRNAYIKKDGSPDLPMWQIFANELKGYSS